MRNYDEAHKRFCSFYLKCGGARGCFARYPYFHTHCVCVCLRVRAKIFMHIHLYLSLYQSLQPFFTSKTKVQHVCVCVCVCVCVREREREREQVPSWVSITEAALGHLPWLPRPEQESIHPRTHQHITGSSPSG